MYEEERILTIYEGLSKQKKKIPRISLRGEWLRELGYVPGKKTSLKVINQDGVIKLNISLTD